jgi:hypothetical protein
MVWLSFRGSCARKRGRAAGEGAPLKTTAQRVTKRWIYDILISRLSPDTITQSTLRHALLCRLSPNTLAFRGGETTALQGFANIDMPVDALVYFAGDPQRAYQIEQWVPVFNQLHASHPVIVVTRNLGTFRRLADSTALPVIFIHRISDVENLLARTDPKLCLYVNNAPANFRTLGWRRALHVHLNHGESDKVSMATNQAKAYDYVLVAGEAAEARYRDNLLGFDGSNLIRIGRPQLDLEFTSTLPVSARRTVLYAPTWEGETPAMNYTSVSKYGPALTRALVDEGGFRVVYKPHPRVVTGSRRIVAAHKEIVRTLVASNAASAEADGHVVEIDTPILGLFQSCDALICDVSSVAIDWLYLRTDAPLWICDPRDDRDTLVGSSPLADHSYILDSSGMPDLVGRIRESLETDPRRAEREEVRQFYFGDLAPGESTRRFLDTIDDFISQRDELLAAQSAAGAGRLAAGVA